MIYVTHDQITAADKMMVLNAGRIQQTRLPLDLYCAPKNLFVAGSPKMNHLGVAEAEKEIAKSIWVWPKHLSLSTESGLGSGTAGTGHQGFGTLLNGHKVWLTTKEAKMRHLDVAGKSM